MTNEAANIEEAQGKFGVPKSEQMQSDPLFIDWNTDEFKEILKFLAIPAVFAFFALILGVVPRAGLYIFAFFYGLALVKKSLDNPEYLMACFVFYIPLSSMMPVSIVTGLNATNLFLMMLIALAFLDRKPALNHTDSGAFDMDQIGIFPDVQRGVDTPLLKFYMFYTTLSGVTAIIANGVGHILSDHLLTYKGWVDQLLLVFVFAALIKDSPRAVRLVVYMMMAHVIIVILGLQEAFDKAGLSSIEKSRVSGTINNPNDFGALVVYTSAPFVGMCMVLLPKFFKLAPFAFQLLLMVRVMLATFSRGAYVAIALGTIAASYVRGIKFSLAMGSIALVAVMLFPSLVPTSLMDRLDLSEDPSHVYIEEAEPALDKSSTMRFLMWTSAVQMSLEAPIFGKGFKMFENLIYSYAGDDIEISDPHNMYLYISSQMGIPAVIIFTLLWVVLFFRSNYLYNQYSQNFVQAIALGGAFVAAAVASFNLTGSRMVSLETCGFAYLYILVINRLHQDLKSYRLRNEKPPEFDI
ncbi:MAG: O-antigen ligase family protein [Pseudomonadales bacterium]